MPVKSQGPVIIYLYEKKTDSLIDEIELVRASDLSETSSICPAVNESGTMKLKNKRTARKTAGGGRIKPKLLIAKPVSNEESPRTSTSTNDEKKHLKSSPTTSGSNFSWKKSLFVYNECDPENNSDLSDFKPIRILRSGDSAEQPSKSNSEKSSESVLPDDINELDKDTASTGKKTADEVQKDGKSDTIEQNSQTTLYEKSDKGDLTNIAKKKNILDNSSLSNISKPAHLLRSFKVILKPLSEKFMKKYNIQKQLKNYLRMKTLQESETARMYHLNSSINQNASTSRDTTSIFVSDPTEDSQFSLSSTQIKEASLEENGGFKRNVEKWLQTLSVNMDNMACPEPEIGDVNVINVAKNGNSSETRGSRSTKNVCKSQSPPPESDAVYEQKDNPSSDDDLQPEDVQIFDDHSDSITENKPEHEERRGRKKKILQSSTNSETAPINSVHLSSSNKFTTESAFSKQLQDDHQKDSHDDLNVSANGSKHVERRGRKKIHPSSAYSKSASENSKISSVKNSTTGTTIPTKQKSKQLQLKKVQISDNQLKHVESFRARKMKILQSPPNLKVVFFPSSKKSTPESVSSKQLLNNYQGGSHDDLNGSETESEHVERRGRKKKIHPLSFYSKSLSENNMVSSEKKSTAETEVPSKHESKRLQRKNIQVSDDLNDLFISDNEPKHMEHRGRKRKNLQSPTNDDHDDDLYDSENVVSKDKPKHAKRGGKKRKVHLSSVDSKPVSRDSVVNSVGNSTSEAKILSKQLQRKNVQVSDDHNDLSISDNEPKRIERRGRKKKNLHPPTNDDLEDEPKHVERYGQKRRKTADSKSVSRDSVVSSVRNSTSETKILSKRLQHQNVQVSDDHSNLSISDNEPKRLERRGRKKGNLQSLVHDDDSENVVFEDEPKHVERRGRKRKSHLLSADSKSVSKDLVVSSVGNPLTETKILSKRLQHKNVEVSDDHNDLSISDNEPKHLERRGRKKKILSSGSEISLKSSTLSSSVMRSTPRSKVPLKQLQDGDQEDDKSSLSISENERKLVRRPGWKKNSSSAVPSSAKKSTKGPNMSSGHESKQLQYTDSNVSINEEASPIKPPEHSSRKKKSRSQYSQSTYSSTDEVSKQPDRKKKPVISKVPRQSLNKSGAFIRNLVPRMSLKDIKNVFCSAKLPDGSYTTIPVPDLFKMYNMCPVVEIELFVHNFL